MTTKQLQAKTEKLMERVIKGQVQLDAWRKELKELREQLDDARKADPKAKAAKK